MITLVYLLIWVLLITSFSLIGSWYARKYQKSDAIIAIYVAFVLVSNIIAFKIAEFDLGFFTFSATSAVIIFSVTFLLTDIINEKFGKAETQRMILVTLIAQVATSIFIWFAISLPPASFWKDQEIFMRVMGFIPRVMGASWVSFLVSENVDAFLFDWIKKKTKGKHLWARNLFSSVPSMILDSVLFVTLAFYGNQPLFPLILGISVLKIFVGIINIPFIYLNRLILFPKKV